MIFKRIAAWSATISKAGPAEAIERYLRLTTRDRYWFGDKNPELVRFYCRRWNRLDQRTRARLEDVILAGMKAETVRRFRSEEHTAGIQSLLRNSSAVF